MDAALFGHLRSKIPTLRQDQCVYPPLMQTAGDWEYDTDIDSFDRHASGERFLQIATMYAKSMHPYIPDMHSVWQTDSAFHIRTSCTRNMKPLLVILPRLSKSMTISILIELCTAAAFMHAFAIHHGMLQEMSVYVDETDMRRIYIKNFSEFATPDFAKARAHDVACLRRMVEDASKTLQFNAKAALHHMSCGYLPGAVNELRSLLQTEITHNEMMFLSWHQTVFSGIMETHALTTFLVDTSDHASLYSSASSALMQVLASSAPVLPLFADAKAIQRGPGVLPPLVDALFDHYISSGMLQTYPNVQGMFPNSLLQDKECFVCLGYLIAYAFVMNISVKCQFSPLLIAYVMDQSLEQRRPEPTLAEITVLKATKQQMYCMHAGSKRITGLQFFCKLPPNKLYEHFYSSHSSVTVTELGIEAFVFEGMNGKEKMNILSWMRSLVAEFAEKFTQLITNTTRLQRNTAKIIIRKSDNLVISTCERSINIPSLWLSDKTMLEECMYAEMNNYSFNTI